MVENAAEKHMDEAYYNAPKCVTKRFLVTSKNNLGKQQEQCIQLQGGC